MLPADWTGVPDIAKRMSPVDRWLSAWLHVGGTPDTLTTADPIGVFLSLI